MPNREPGEHYRSEADRVRDPALRDALRPLAERLGNVYPDRIRYGFEADTTRLAWEVGVQFLSNGQGTRSVLFLCQQVSRTVGADAIPGFARQEWDDFLSELDDQTSITSPPRQYESAVYYVDMSDGTVESESYAELWISVEQGGLHQQKRLAALDIGKAVATKHLDDAVVDERPIDAGQQPVAGQRSQHAWHILHMLQELRVMDGFVAPEDIAAVRALLGYNK
jgi:hypothetical protein